MFRNGRKNVSRCPEIPTFPGCRGKAVPGIWPTARRRVAVTVPSMTITPEALGGIVFGEPLTHHSVANLVGDSNACGTGSKDDHALVAQRRPADADGGDRRRQRDGAGALYIVVEGADPVAVLLEDAPPVARREVLPLQQRIRE